MKPIFYPVKRFIHSPKFSLCSWFIIVLTLGFLSGCGKKPEQPLKPEEVPSATNLTTGSETQTLEAISTAITNQNEMVTLEPAIGMETNTNVVGQIEPAVIPTNLYEISDTNLLSLSNGTIEVRAAISLDPIVIVLGYHQFDSPVYTPYSIATSLFHQHMEYLRDTGWSVIPLQQLVAFLKGQTNIPQKSVVLTIDDGYRSVYLRAYPILKEFGYPWTFFCYTDFIGKGSGACTWDQLREMATNGCEIHSHTKSHPFLTHRKGKSPAQYEEWLNMELAGSRLDLEKEIGKPVYALAYSYGDWNSHVQQKALEGGYEALFTVASKPVRYNTPLNNIGRYIISKENEAKFTQYFTAAQHLLLASGKISHPTNSNLNSTNSINAMTNIVSNLTRVVQITNPNAVQKFQVFESAVRDMLGEGLKKWSGKSTASEAILTVIQTNDVVGLKISSEGGPVLGTKKVLVKAMIDILLTAGLPAQNIIVWDKNKQDMIGGGFVASQMSENEPQYLSVISDAGFDETVFYQSPPVGELIWGDLEFKEGTSSNPLMGSTSSTNRRTQENKLSPADMGPPSNPDRQQSNKSYYTKLVTKQVTKIINMPILANSEAVGIQGCLASLALGCVDNTRRFLADPYRGDPAIPEIFENDVVKNKTVLHIMDGLLGQFAGGPSFIPAYCREYATLYLSQDPVAIDTLAAEQIEKWRSSAHLPALRARLGYLKTAMEIGLGQNDSTLIQVETIDPE